MCTSFVGQGGCFRTDSTSAAHAAGAGALGIGLAPPWQIRDLVDNGVVEVILEDFEIAKTPIHAVLPPSKMPLTKTRLFVDMLTARLKHERL